ncbi:cadmium-induced protein AS8 [Panicum miliaceum]|uniref:Cadmium-induced protein AS8 n=1 Tax=Panicum miliaceum TaxID=4540 RepID=A0A3L6TCH1_PANMI|nr:cadmium-induced protein AS8 [Panicum miliaceum]
MPDSPQLQHPPPPPAPPPPPPPPPPATSPTPAESAAANAQPNLIPVKPTMIIKGVLGRYERWNPVHPTAGTFWGVGLGLGCGVGWGPGFGPEVIGYVGAGCGVGFSVGFTLAGVGIGLPQHGFIRNHDDSSFASNVSLDSARYYAVTVIKGLVWDAINYAGNVTAMRKESRQNLPKFQDNPPVSGGVDLPKLGKGVSTSIQSTVECIKAFKDEHWPS